MSQDSSFTNIGTAIAENILPNNIHSGTSGNSEAQQMLDNFWPKVVEDIKKLTVNDFKNQELPLARIKKIMKLDDDVKVMMISAEAPVLFAKAAEIFITETSLRAWIHTEDNKRRTLQRNDIAMAITKNDQFDFLIDIVPRDEVKPQVKRPTQPGQVSVGGMTIDTNNTTLTPDQIQNYCYALAQQQQQQQQQSGLQQATTATGQPQQIQILQTPSLQPGANQTYTLTNTPQLVHVQVPNAQNSGGNDMTTNNGQQSPVTQGQVFQLAGQGATATATTQAQASSGQIQILQQVLTSNGEIVQQPIPIQLNPAQLQLIRLQSQATNQPIIIQAAQLNQNAGQYQIAGQPFLTQTVVTSSASGGTVETDSQIDDDNDQNS